MNLFIMSFSFHLTGRNLNDIIVDVVHKETKNLFFDLFVLFFQRNFNSENVHTIHMDELFSICKLHFIEESLIESAVYHRTLLYQLDYFK